MIRKAVILAAGRGTRFYPYTKYVAKEMLPIVDVPALQLICEEVINSGIKDICVVTNPEKHTMNSFFDIFTMTEGDAYVKKVYQNVPNGTGAAVLLTKDFCEGEPFALLNGDDLIYTDENTIPATKQLCDYYEICKTSIIGVQYVGAEQISKYGAIKIVKQEDRAYQINGIIEKPLPEEAPSFISALGRYIITPDIYDYLMVEKPNSKGELVLTDALNSMAIKKGIHAYDFIGRRYDLGSKEGYSEAVTEYTLRRPGLKEEYLKFLKSIIK
ncbi:MAG: UTP--glucose-1-phosphate uridylyltransferase [Clostridia bacterium]